MFVQNFLYRLRCSLARFMYGRNGVDALNYAIFALEIILSLLRGLIRIPALSLVFDIAGWVLWAAFIYRTFSRNLEKRRAENARFWRWWSPKWESLRGAKARSADKAHKYVKCSCGAWCRVPRNIGKVELTCPKCGKKKIVKT